jgi:hypothetical protein
MLPGLGRRPGLLAVVGRMVLPIELVPFPILWVRMEGIAAAISNGARTSRLWRI